MKPNPWSLTSEKLKDSHSWSIIITWRYSVSHKKRVLGCSQQRQETKNRNIGLAFEANSPTPCKNGELGINNNNSKSMTFATRADREMHSEFYLKAPHQICQHTPIQILEILVYTFHTSKSGTIIYRERISINTHAPPQHPVFWPSSENPLVGLSLAILMGNCNIVKAVYHCKLFDLRHSLLIRQTVTAHTSGLL